MKYLVGIVGVLFAVAAHAQMPDREKLIGSWTNSAAGESQALWTIAAAGSDTIRITRVESGRTVEEVECNTAGRECATKEDGKPVKVSIWFNGPKLVVMQVRGSEVVKRRFHATGDGGAMDVEIIPIVPQGKPEVLRLTRAPASH